MAHKNQFQFSKFVLRVMKETLTAVSSFQNSFFKSGSGVPGSCVLGSKPIPWRQRVAVFSFHRTRGVCVIVFVFGLRTPKNPDFSSFLLGVDILNSIVRRLYTWFNELNWTFYAAKVFLWPDLQAPSISSLLRLCLAGVKFFD